MLSDNNKIWNGLTAPIPPLAPVIRTVLPSRRDVLKTEAMSEDVCK